LAQGFAFTIDLRFSASAPGGNSASEAAPAATVGAADQYATFAVVVDFIGATARDASNIAHITLTLPLTGDAATVGQVIELDAITPALGDKIGGLDGTRTDIIRPEPAGASRDSIAPHGISLTVSAPDALMNKDVAAGESGGVWWATVIGALENVSDSTGETAVVAGNTAPRAVTAGRPGVFPVTSFVATGPGLALRTSTLGLKAGLGQANFRLDLLPPVVPGSGTGRGAGLPVVPALSSPTPATAEEESPLWDLGGALLQAMFLGNLSRPGPEPAVVGLMRAPGDSGLAVADLIQRSTDAFTRLVQKFYQFFLGRDAKPGEEQGWVAALQGGQTQEQVLAAFLSTPEFASRANTLISTGTPDERYLQALYQVLLQRPATDTELSSWLSALPSLERRGVALVLLGSTEYRSLQVATLYSTLLGRAASPEEVAAWASSPFDLLTIQGYLQSRPDLFGSPAQGGWEGS
jgi:hypothetical protein